ncbi:MAG TPA: hypothetical protein VMJ34_18405 [Bryobacteraceae bacterium]|nr:hypothetical protein [Bryobacteraceae bacterium]
MTLLLVQAAQATTLLAGYTDLSEWEAAVTETGLDTFDSISGVGNTSTYSNPSGYTDPLGIDFVGAFATGGNYLEAVGPSLSQNYNYGSGNSLMSGYSSGSNQPYITVNLPAGVTAIALDVMTYGNIWPVTLTASDGSTYTIATSSGQRSFYGFTFSAPISNLKVSIPGSPLFTYALLDNVRIGTCGTGGGDPSPVPETASLFLIGAGLLVLACLKKFRTPDTM